MSVIGAAPNFCCRFRYLRRDLFLFDGGTRTGGTPGSVGGGLQTIAARGSSSAGAVAVAYAIEAAGLAVVAIAPEERG